MIIYYSFATNLGRRIFSSSQFILKIKQRKPSRNRVNLSSSTIMTSKVRDSRKNILKLLRNCVNSFNSTSLLSQEWPERGEMDTKLLSTVKLPAFC